MRPGTRVVCVNDKFHPIMKKHVQALPKEGKTYIVRDLVPIVGGTGFTLTLVGVANRFLWFDYNDGKRLREPSFELSRFRIVDKKDANDWGESKIKLLETCNN